MYLFYQYSVITEAVVRRCSVKKSVPKNFTKFTGKHLCQRLFFIKKESLTQAFSCEFCEVSKNTFFTEHFRTTVPGKQKRNLLKSVV